MSLIELASWSTIIQAVVVIVSLFFIWVQLRQSSELAKASNVQSLVEHASSFNSMLIQNEDITRLWYGRGKNLKSISDKGRYRELLVQWLLFHENIFYQHRKGLLDSKIYKAWDEDLKFFVHTQHIEMVTKDWDGYFPGTFGKHIIELQKESFNDDYQPVIAYDKKK